VTQATELANREFTDKQIQTRIEAASKTGFGMAGATVDQRNMVYLFAKHYDVDPIIDVTLQYGQPTLTIDGRIRTMKRHPQYRGYKCRPLSASEKEAWGYKANEIVVECTIRTRDWGEISARGKVNPEEFARQPVARQYPQEMAEKRAIARASRLAFGQDVPDDEEFGRLAYEQQHPEAQRVAALAAKHEQIYAQDDAPLPQTPAPAQPPNADDLAERADALEDNRRLLDGAESVGVLGLHAFKARETWPLERVLGANDELRERIHSREGERATTVEGQVELPA